MNGLVGCVVHLNLRQEVAHNEMMDLKDVEVQKVQDVANENLGRWTLPNNAWSVLG